KASWFPSGWRAASIWSFFITICTGSISRFIRPTAGRLSTGCWPTMRSRYYLSMTGRTTGCAPRLTSRCNIWLRTGRVSSRRFRSRVFPNETYNGVIHSLNRLTCDYRWTTRVYSLDREDQEEKLKEARNSWHIRRKGFWDMLTGATGGQETQDEDVSKAYKNLSAISKMQDTSIALAEIADRK